MATNPDGSTYRPLFFYVVYELDGDWYGYLVDWKPAWEAEKDYEVVYHIEGREAAYWIATDDRSLLRQDAISFAIRVHTGKCRILHTDLSAVSRWR